MKVQRRSLRLQLAVPAFITLLLAVFLLLATLTISETTTIIERPGTQESEISEELTFTPWIFPLTLVLAIPIAIGVWRWAGRTVKPISALARLTDDIQAGSLGRRIELVDATDEVQQLADSFNRMLDRLERASKIQQQLIENTSHELRTPLAVLSTNVEVMLADPAPTLPAYRDSTQLIERTVARLNRIVNDLLNQARFDRYTTEQSNNDLSQIALHVLDNYKDAAFAGQIELLSHLVPTLLCAAEGTSVERAVSNLLDNAIRHSPSGSQVVLETGVRDGKAYLSVTDQGSGIRQADLKHIYDRYWSRRDGFSNVSGIGLSIVKQVADAHAGLEVQTPVAADRGVRFTLLFDR